MTRLLFFSIALREMLGHGIEPTKAVVVAKAIEAKVFDMPAAPETLPKPATASHGEACPHCGGCIVWTESQEYNDRELKCGECGRVFAPEGQTL